MPERRSASGTAVASNEGVEFSAATRPRISPRCAYAQRIAPAIIARIYYDPDEDPHAATPGAMERHLITMLDTPGGARPRLDGLADHLRASIRQHGYAKLTAVTFRTVTDAAQLAALPPHPDHAIGA